jgi:diguanylate cyclase (GGDEF)-like protein
MLLRQQAARRFHAAARANNIAPAWLASAVLAAKNRQHRGVAAASFLRRPGPAHAKIVTMTSSTSNLSRFSLSLWLTLATFVVFAASFVVYVRAEKQIDRANEQRQQSFQLAEELRQSSDDLTRMVRTYVVTGDTRYKRHYQEILDIRDGRKPRPLDYQNIYWDLVLADDRRPRPAEQAVALLELMRQAGFSAAEFAKLAEAKANSDALTNTEFAAMALIEASSPASELTRNAATRMLHDAAYHQAKAGIMGPIGEFHRMADQRTLAAVQAALTQATQTRLAFMLFGLLLGSLLWRVRRNLHAVLGASVSELHSRIARLGSGDFATPIVVTKEMSNSVLGWLSETQIKLAGIDAERQAAQARQQRVTQLYAALSQCNQAIVRCSDESELFRQICHDVVTFGGMAMAWIGELDPQSGLIAPTATFGDGIGYLEGLRISVDPAEPHGRGPSGIALREDRPYWCQDFLHDPATAPWHERAELFGWRASAALPLHRDGKPAGVFNIYADVVHAFDEDVRKLLEEMVLDIDHALKNFAREKQRQEAEARIQYLAHFDALTGLPNRAQLEDRARYALSLAQRNHVSLAVMFLDLDHFKDINDSLGHSIGDVLLIELAKRLRQVLRDDDTVSRLGGDEFIFLLYGIDAQGAAHVAQKLLEVIAEPYRIDHYDLNVSGSIGIALYPGDGGDLESLSKSADAAMYHVKQEGRRGYRFFTSEMQSRSARHLQLVNALRLALERDQMQVHYQPQIAMHGQAIVGAEALLRWTHPELGPVSPAEFIPAAEDSGLILPIGEWVLRQAARQAKQWMQDGLPPLVMAVNLSAVQFRHPDLPALVSRILDEEGLPPEYLELELTEGVAMHDPQGAIAVMNNLHERGVRMSIDDFGTGYSSLSHLKKFKVYKLKIDQSFVRDISTDPEDKAIVGAIINMAKSLGLQTIAEGVETAGQLAFLHEQGCDETQGYYFSRPLPAEQFAAWAQARLIGE